MSAVEKKNNFLSYLIRPVRRLKFGRNNYTRPPNTTKLIRASLSGFNQAQSKHALTVLSRGLIMAWRVKTVVWVDHRCV